LHDPDNDEEASNILNRSRMRNSSPLKIDSGRFQRYNLIGGDDQFKLYTKKEFTTIHANASEIDGGMERHRSMHQKMLTDIFTKNYDYYNAEKSSFVDSNSSSR